MWYKVQGSNLHWFTCVPCSFCSYKCLIQCIDIYIHVFVWMCDSLYNVKQESCKSLLFCELSNTILWTNKCFGYFSIYPATNTVNSKSVV